MNYNYIAPYYDLISRICFLKRQQIAHKIILKYLKNNDKILWLGGGSGWFLDDIDKLNLNLEIDYVELSSVMINKAKSRDVSNLKINFFQEDFFHFKTSTSYDVIITAFIFDHFSVKDCEFLFEKYNKVLKKNGIWIYIDFCQNQNFIQQLLTKMMVKFFSIVANINTKDFPEMEYLFSNYKLIEVKKYFRKYIHSKVYIK